MSFLADHRPTELHPTAVVVTRQEAIHDPAHYAAGPAAPGIPVEVYPQERPLPVEQSDFWPVGKTFDHAWPHQRIQMSLAIPEWLSVMGWPFLPGMRAEPGALIAYQSFGSQGPIQDRTAIDVPTQVKLSDLTAVAGSIGMPIDASYLKLY